MAQKNINIGTGELKGDGETLRSAFSKIEDNFTELYAGGGGSGIALTDLSVGAEGTPSGDGAIAYDNTTGVFTYTPPAGGGGGITEIVQDTTPQLGGNLDMNGFEIVTTNGGHIRLDPDTTGGVGIGNVTNAATLLHLQQSAPIITLQRLDNTLSQGISWTGQNGVEAAHIKLDGTGGITNTLIMSAFDGSSVTERLRVMADVGKGIKVTGDIESDGVLKLITTQGNDNIQLETNGTGNVLLKGDKVGIGIVNQPDTLLHLKDTNSVITLQRTADANTPGLSFQQSGGNARAELKMDGTNGTSNEIFIKTDNQDGNGLVERLRVGHTATTVAGNLIVSGDFTVNGTTTTVNTTEMTVSDNIITLNSDVTGAPSQNAGIEVERGSSDNVSIRWNETSDQWEFTNDGASYTAIGSGGGGISNVVEDTTPELGGDLNVGGNSIVGGNGPINLAPGGTAAINLSADETITTGKILYSNMYAQLADLPNATTYHGMFAHVHATGAGYFAHGGNWIRLANYTDLSPYLPTANLNTNIDLHLNKASAGNNEVLSWDGADYAWVAQSGGGSSNAISQGNTNVTVTDTGSDGKITFDTEGTDRWAFTNGGHLIPESNAAYDIGSADYKVRHLFLSDNSLKFVDSGDVEYSLGVVGAKLQYQGEDILQAVSTDNVNMNVNGSGLGISIGTASTSGSTISIGAEVNNTSVNMYGVTEFGARAIFNRGVHEKFLTITGATGTVDHNVMNGHVFYHTGAAANWTANFTNLSLAQEDATNIAIVIDQGNTSYIPNAVQIGGVAQTVVWNGNSVPTGTDNGKDIVSFTILNDGGTYVIFGQLVSFGGV